jgi:hypothetical protein
MFKAIKKIIEAFDKGDLTLYGFEIALADYDLFGGDGSLAIESGKTFQEVLPSER